MDKGAVIYATHEIFWKKVFRNHADTLEQLTQLNNYNLIEGFQHLKPFFSGYSYYLREIKPKLNELERSTKDKYKQDEIYNLIKLSFQTENYSQLNKERLRYFNNENNKILLKLFDSFERICLKLIEKDIMPVISTGRFNDYDRTLIFALYDSFYEYLFNTHTRIIDQLTEFNILQFNQTRKSLMAYFFGYSYYIKDAREKILNKLDYLLELGNKDEVLIFNLLLLKGQEIPKDILKKVSEIKEEMIEELNNVFELINEELPKSNIFPKEVDKVTEDLHLI